MRACQLIFLYLLAAWIVYVAIRIEVLSEAAGGFPSPAIFAHNKAHGGSGKWRATWMNEERWRAWHIKDAKGEPDPRTLTAEEDAEMRQEIHFMNANLALRDFVSNYGWLLQYMVVLVVVVVGGNCAIRYRRQPKLFVLYLLPVLVAILGGAVAVHRGYFSVMAIGI